MRSNMQLSGVVVKDGNGISRVQKAETYNMAAKYTTVGVGLI